MSKPILFKDTKILILGSSSSIESHPQNQFWKILSSITGYPSLIKDQKMWLLKQSRLGLCNMIEPNDIATLLESYPHIDTIAFTEKKPQQLFENLEIKKVYLPSPLTAYTKMTIEEKSIIYKENLIK